MTIGRRILLCVDQTNIYVSSSIFKSLSYGRWTASWEARIIEKYKRKGEAVLIKWKWIELITKFPK